MEDAIAVIGSVNMDIGGYSHGPLTAGDSNPGLSLIHISEPTRRS